MTRYLVRRAVLSAITIWLVTLIAFVLLRVAPGDAVLAAMARSPGEGTLTDQQLEQRRADLGLDRSYPVQYFVWLDGLARLDAGNSLVSGIPVSEEVAPRIAVTIELSLLALALAGITGAVTGVIAAGARGGRFDAGASLASMAGLSAPAFWLGLLVVLALAIWADLFVAAGYKPIWEDPAGNLLRMVPAAAVLAVRPGSLIFRVVRTATVEVLESDFVRTARAKGLGSTSILWGHAFRASALPGLTVLGAQTVFLLSGSVVIEQVFGLPGLGRLLTDGVLSRDYPVVQFLVMLFGLFAIMANLVVDFAYSRLDPRVRFEA